MARAEGTPSAVAVATVIALASLGSLASASAIHSWNRANGSWASEFGSDICGVSCHRLNVPYAAASPNPRRQ